MLVVITLSTRGYLVSAWHVVSLKLTRSVHRTALPVVGIFIRVLFSAAIICSMVCFGSELVLSSVLIYLFLTEGQLQYWFLPRSELFCF